MTGKVAEQILGEAGITVNKNTVPGEQRSPMVTSGIRIGTPAMTTRNMGVAESRQIADWIADIASGGLSLTLRPELWLVWVAIPLLVVLLLAVLGLIAQLAVLLGAESKEAKTASGGSTLTKAAQKRVRAP